MSEEKSIYNMKLHEQINLNDKCLIITRVASGWIYESFDIDNQISSSTFVPFNNEFQQTEVEE